MEITTQEAMVEIGRGLRTFKAFEKVAEILRKVESAEQRVAELSVVAERLAAEVVASRELLQTLRAQREAHLASLDAQIAERTAVAESILVEARRRAEAEAAELFNSARRRTRAEAS